MQKVTLTINNDAGLHARPASLFCNTAQKFDSVIKVTREGKNNTADGKSILSVLMLEVSMGSSITIEATGEDEALAIQGLSDLINSNFGE